MELLAKKRGGGNERAWNGQLVKYKVEREGSFNSQDGKALE